MRGVAGGLLGQLEVGTEGTGAEHHDHACGRSVVLGEGLGDSAPAPAPGTLALAEASVRCGHSLRGGAVSGIQEP